MKTYRPITVLSVLLCLALGLMLYYRWTANQKGERLTEVSDKIASLERQIELQRQLSKADTLLVQGRYEDALTHYENQEATIIENEGVGVALRMAIAERLLAFEDGLVPKSNAKEAEVEVDSSEVKAPITTLTLHQMDSLVFALEKAKVQVTRMRKQRQSKSSGAYLTFTNSKGSKLHYVGEIKNGKANGYGVALLNTGSRYVGEWKDNQRFGLGTYYWSDGEYYEGEFKNDKRNGQGTYYWPNGEKFVGLWKNDERTGEGIFYDKNQGIVARGIWEGDELVKNNRNTAK